MVMHGSIENVPGMRRNLSPVYGDSAVSRTSGDNFKNIFGTEMEAASKNTVIVSSPTSFMNSSAMVMPASVAAKSDISAKDASKVYQMHDKQNIQHLSSWQKYKDDQLLRNPGGDDYIIKADGTVGDDISKSESAWDAVKKDAASVWGNIKNFFGNLFCGTDFSYRAEDGTIKQGKTRGLIGSVADCFKSLGKAFTFGAFETEDPPEGLWGRVKYFFSNIKKAVFDDLIGGVTGSTVRMAENAAITALNLAEIVPDATIGNFKIGRDATSAIFDNAQVAVSYVADILPGGEGWKRVHSGNYETDNFKLPVLNNITKPEHSNDDTRWSFVRNTTFRKAIETIGSFAADVFLLRFLDRKTSLFGGEDDK